MKYTSDFEFSVFAPTRPRTLVLSFGTCRNTLSSALPSFCASVDEATRLANSFATRLGMLPLDAQTVRDLSTDPNPLPTLLDGGLKPVEGYGWNLRLNIVPLKVRE